MALTWFADGFDGTGTDADNQIHAIRNTISGPRPWCGAGRVTSPPLGKFSGRDGRSCPICAELIAPLLPRQRDDD